MKILSVTMMQQRERTENRLQILSSVLSEFLQNNDLCFEMSEKQQTITQVQSQACMLGIQELATNINIQQRS